MNSSCYTFDFQGASPPALGEHSKRLEIHFLLYMDGDSRELFPRRTCSFFFLFLFSLYLHDACNLDGSVSREAKGKPMDVGSTKVRYFVKL